MSPWFEWPIRVAAAIAAGLVFYLAWFVYEDEEKRIQSRLEDWWLQLDDARVAARSRQAAFIEVTSQKTLVLLEHLYGPVSNVARAIAASFLLWNACLLLNDAVLVSPTSLVLVVFIALLAAWLVLSIANLPLTDFPEEIYAVLAVLVTLITAEIVLERERWFSESVVGAAIVAVLACVARVLLRRIVDDPDATHSRRFDLGAAMVFSPVVLIGAFLVWVTGYEVWVDSLRSACQVLTVLPLGVAGFFILMLLHRLFWPSLGRALYPVQRHGMVKNKTLLNTVAVTLLGIAALPWEKLGDTIPWENIRTWVNG